MHRTISRRGVLWAATLALAAGGCGGGRQAVAPPAPNDGLVDLREMLRRTAAAGEPVPTSAADLRALDAAYPAAGRFIATGQVVYLWGCRLSDKPESATRVVAFEKAAATEGGFVLLQDGTIRQVTAAEFAQLAKAEP